MIPTNTFIGHVLGNLQARYEMQSGRMLIEIEVRQSPQHPFLTHPYWVDFELDGTRSCITPLTLEEMCARNAAKRTQVASMAGGQ